MGAKNNGQIFYEYDVLVAAKDFNAAHEIVVAELAPEAIIRGDLSLLRRLIAPFSPSIVVNWDVGGQVNRIIFRSATTADLARLQVFLDYADAMQGVGNSDLELDVELIEGLAKTYKGLKMAACVQEMKENLIKLSPSLSKVSLAHHSTNSADNFRFRQARNLVQSHRLLLLGSKNANFLSSSLAMAMES